MLKNKKIQIKLASLLVAFFVSTLPFVSERAFARSEDDVCKIYLCMAGKVMGKGGDTECRSSEKAFFKVAKFQKGKFKPSATLNLRKRLLGGCSSADPKYVKKILSAFGKMLLKK